MKYSVVGCGGTFDYLHTGHKAFLRFVFSKGEKVLIGLTSDAYIAAYKPAQNVQSYFARKQQLEDFLHKEKFSGRFTITPIDTIFGPAIDPSISIDALVATEETKDGVQQVNKKRNELGLPTLPIVLMPLITVAGAKISSTNIRLGKINTAGSRYIEESIATHLLLLPDALRDSLAVPFGQLFTNKTIPFSEIDATKSVTVGDATTVAFHSHGLYPKLAVVDLTVQRKKAYASLEEEGFSQERRVRVINPPGTIVPQLWEVLQNIVLDSSENYVLTVDGEEDLVVLPLVMVLPLGFTVFYGQPNRGMVKVLVTLEVKDTAKRLLEQFNRA